MSATREIISPPDRAPNAERSSGQLASMAVRGGDFIFVSGLTAVDLQSGERLRGTTASETRHILANLQQVLEAAGSSLERLVQVRAMIYDRIEYDALNRVYRQYVPQGPPARTVWSVRIIDAFKVQLDAVALA